MNKILFIAFFALCFCVPIGCVWQISSPIELIVVLENQTNKALTISSHHSNTSVNLAPGRTVSLSHGIGSVVVQSVEDKSSIEYYIDIGKLEGKLPPEIKNGVFSSSWSYRFIIGKDWKIYCKINDESDINKLEQLQPKGFPLSPIQYSGR